QPPASHDAVLILGLAFLEPAATTFLGRLEAANFLRRLRSDLRHLDGPALAVDRHEGEIARIRVPAAPGEQLLCFHADADLHARAAHVVHTRLHDDEVAQVDG